MLLNRTGVLTEYATHHALLSTATITTIYCHRRAHRDIMSIAIGVLVSQDPIQRPANHPATRAARRSGSKQARVGCSMLDDALLGAHEYDDS